ncbi:hypothetical protein J15TS10_16280 [Paenibacillus woosongensis]|uniref:Uncharacterized protein n=2 Tax=Paenibacillus TaxID=44249 RepID=A0ABQ4MP85_9BACL|nr:hypothetical protein J15TS10_16280 [Paenibacillus woosongensis]
MRSIQLIGFLAPPSVKDGIAHMTQQKPEAGHDKLSDTAEEKVNVMYDMTLRWAQQLEQSRIIEYAELLYHPWSLIWRNVLAGMARGVGIAIGFTFFAATIIYILQILGALNLPIIGDYIADIVRIVQRQLELKTF